MPDLMSGLLAAGAVIVGMVGLRFLIAVANGSEGPGGASLSGAFRETGEWTLGVAIGTGSAVSLGLMSVGDLTGQLLAFVGGHPFFASNFGIVALAAGVLEGVVSLSTQQFIGIGMMIVGATFLATEVDDVLA